MTSNLREIKRRIKSGKNTRQITKTMEMVSASKMRKVQNETLKSRTYAEKALEILTALSQKKLNQQHPFLQPRTVKHQTFIVVSTERGLCGGFNTSLVAELNKQLDVKNPEKYSFITLGKKGRDALMRQGLKVEADFSGTNRNDPGYILPICEMVFKNFLEGKTDEVKVIYTHFINTMKQKPIVRTLFPLTYGAFIDLAKSLSGKAKEIEPVDFLVEPNATVVLESLIPPLVESQIWQSVLESEASEHSARMITMKNATDAATDIIKDLTLLGNQMRQNAITAEISEIVSAGEAMR